MAGYIYTTRYSAVYIKMLMPYLNDIKSVPFSVDNSTSPAVITDNTNDITLITSPVTLETFSVLSNNNIGSLNTYTFDISDSYSSDYLIYKSSLNIYCNIASTHTFTLPEQACKVSSSQDYQYTPTDSIDTYEWLYLTLDGTITCSPTELLSNPDVINIEYIIETATTPSLQISHNYFSVYTYDCSSIDYCTQCEANTDGMVICTECVDNYYVLNSDDNVCDQSSYLEQIERVSTVINAVILVSILSYYIIS